ncbi:MAG: exodeoxyribonuclease III [Lachnospiraceae bacterium]|nr:exodeoxyribonuclease III [Lachnospiraceae bacterium]
MRILTWNLSGIKSCIRRNDFSQLEPLKTLDVICFQETRTPDKLTAIEGYHHFWYPSSDKHSSGTLTLSLVEPEDVIYGFGIPEFDREGRVLTLEFGSLFIVNTYMPRSQGSIYREEFREKWDEAYRSFLMELSSRKPVIACGDFNVTASREDIYEENTRMDWAENGYTSEERSSLNKLFSEGFIDAYRLLYPDEKNAFTWWSNRLNKRAEDRGWRLDYFLVSPPLKDSIRNVTLHPEITGSDHCPLSLDCDICDDEYKKEYDQLLREKRASQYTEKKLAEKWNNRQRQFKKYEEKLLDIQSRISAKAGLHHYDDVRNLQIELMDDIRFRCLAVNRIANSKAPAGVDGIRWRTGPEKMQAALDLEWRNYEASPRRIVDSKTKRNHKSRKVDIITHRDKAISLLQICIRAGRGSPRRQKILRLPSGPLQTGCSRRHHEPLLWP